MVSRRSVLAMGASGAVALSSGCLGFVTGNEALEFEASKVIPTERALAETGYEESDSGWERIEETVDVGVERDIRASFWMALYSKRVTLSADDLDLEGIDLEGYEGELDETDLEGYDEELGNVSDIDPEAYDLEDYDGELENASQGGFENASDDDLENADDGDVEESDLEEDGGELAGELEREAAMFAAISMPAIKVLGSAQNPLADVDAEELVEQFRGELEGNYGTLRDVEFEETIDLEILGEDRSVDRFRATTTVESRGAEVDVDLDLRVTIFEDGDDLVVLLGGHPTELAEEGSNVEALMASVEHPPAE